MIYPLLHWLFGWDYICWHNSVSYGVARVHAEEGTGRVWYWRYKNIALIDVIKEPSQVVWLTCAPTKYGWKEKV